VDDETRIIADALVSYADSCTLPGLTPSCPFYRSTEDGPTCGEQCRDVIHRFGGEERPVESHDLAGLVMHGRSLPIRVAGGLAEFDATRSYLQDRDRAAHDQSTPSLLLSLRAMLVEHAITGTGDRVADAESVWRELTRRIPGMEQVFAGGLAADIGSAVSTRVILDHLTEKDGFRLDDVIGRPTQPQARTWLAAARASSLSDPSRLRIRGRFAPDLDLLRRVLPQLFESPDDAAALRDDPLVVHVLSPIFRNRVARWLSNLLTVDLTATLRVDPPTEAVFAVLDGASELQDVGGWLWERFTVTNVDDWSYASLVLEWDWVQRGSTDLCDPRAMAERSVSEERLSRLALQRAASTRLQPRSRTRAFDPSFYVPHALDLLVNGDVDGASRIFEGLVELSPGDASGWNNLGFCQLPLDTQGALTSLRRAEALSRAPSQLSAANQTLALHLLGRDDEAVEVGTAALRAENAVEIGSSWVWMHPTDDDADLQLGDVPRVADYLTPLLEHIQSDECGAARRGE